ncbi:hypothetical protein ASN88_00380 [Streptococcus parauberis]|nr:hypothetical protein ASN88_00380 [Streptococcus parauberis]
MAFNWINGFNSIVIILLMIPNIHYAKNYQMSNKLTKVPPKWITILEQIGRYGCMILMVLPIFVWEFRLYDRGTIILYVTYELCLLLVYYYFWSSYLKQKQLKSAITLAIIPTLIFLLSGMVLAHTLLIIAASISGFAHILITLNTHLND